MSDENKSSTTYFKLKMFETFNTAGKYIDYTLKCQAGMLYYKTTRGKEFKTLTNKELKIEEIKRVGNKILYFFRNRYLNIYEISYLFKDNIVISYTGRELFREYLYALAKEQYPDLDVII